MILISNKMFHPRRKKAKEKSPDDLSDADQFIESSERKNKRWKIVGQIMTAVSAAALLAMGAVSTTGYLENERNSSRENGSAQSNSLEKLKQIHSSNKAEEMAYKRQLIKALEEGKSISTREFLFTSERVSRGVHMEDENRATDIVDRHLEELNRTKPSIPSPETLAEVESITKNSKQDYALSRTSVIRFINRAGLPRRGNCEAKAFSAAMYLEELYPERKNDISFQVFKGEYKSHIRALFTIAETGKTYAIETGIPEVTNEEKAKTIILTSHDLIARYAGDPRFIKSIKAPLPGTSKAQKLYDTDSIIPLSGIEGETISYGKQENPNHVGQEWESEKHSLALEAQAEIFDGQNVSNGENIAPAEGKTVSTHQMRATNSEQTAIPSPDFSIEDAEKALSELKFIVDKQDNFTSFEPVVIDTKNPTKAGIEKLYEGLKKIIGKNNSQIKIVFKQDISNFPPEVFESIFKIANITRLDLEFKIRNGTIPSAFLEQLKLRGEKTIQKDLGYLRNKPAGGPLIGNNLFELDLVNMDNSRLPIALFKKLIESSIPTYYLSLEGFKIDEPEANAISKAQNVVAEVEQALFEDYQKRGSTLVGRSISFTSPNSTLISDDGLNILNRISINSSISTRLSHYFDYIQRDPSLIENKNISFSITTLDNYASTDEVKSAYEKALSALDTSSPEYSKNVERLKEMYNMILDF